MLGDTQHASASCCATLASRMNVDTERCETKKDKNNHKMLLDSAKALIPRGRSLHQGTKRDDQNPVDNTSSVSPIPSCYSRLYVRTNTMEEQGDMSYERHVVEVVLGCPGSCS